MDLLCCSVGVSSSTHRSGIKDAKLATAANDTGDAEQETTRITITAANDKDDDSDVEHPPDVVLMALDARYIYEIRQLINMFNFTDYGFLRVHTKRNRIATATGR